MLYKDLKISNSNNSTIIIPLFYERSFNSDSINTQNKESLESEPEMISESSESKPEMIPKINSLGTQTKIKPSIPLRSSNRETRPPTWLSDYKIMGVFPSEEIPSKFSDIEKCTDREKWKVAVQEELLSLKQNNT